MNDTKLTTFDPAKTYVDPYGRRWTPSDMADRWDTESLPFRFVASDLLGLYPDLREHVPQWYEPLLEKGWVKLSYIDILVRLGNNGELVRLNHDDDPFSEEGGPFNLTNAGFQHHGSLESCLAAAEPLVWKGVAS